MSISTLTPTRKSLNPALNNSCQALNKMPYRRRSYRPRTTRKRTKRSGYGGARKRRSYPTTRRRYPRKMSNKRVLNLTSRKKRDNMLSWSNTTVALPVGNSTYGTGPAVLRGDQTYIFGWMPTARDFLDGNNNPGVVSDVAMRTSQTCFMRGLSEAINVRTNTGAAWQWRRVCFTYKGNGLTTAANDVPYQYFTQRNIGMVRTMNNLNTSPKGDLLLSILFRGQQNADWLNVFNAPLDTTRVSVKFDRTRSIASGNDSGVVRTYKHWLPMNKNLVYDDDENGDGTATRFTSTTGKAGMGDYYVVDFIQCSDGADSSDTMAVLPEASLYWHEK